MTPKERSAIQQALEALEMIATYSEEDKQCDNGYGAAWVANTAITDLREALAEQEPVGRWNWNEAKFEWLTKFDYHKHHMTPLYAAPVRTKNLTDDEIRAMFNGYVAPEILLMFRAVIAADRENNK